MSTTPQDQDKAFDSGKDLFIKFQNDVLFDKRDYNTLDDSSILYLKHEEQDDVHPPQLFTPSPLKLNPNDDGEAEERKHSTIESITKTPELDPSSSLTSISSFYSFNKNTPRFNTPFTTITTYPPIFNNRYNSETPCPAPPITPRHPSLSSAPPKLPTSYSSLHASFFANPPRKSTRYRHIEDLVIIYGKLSRWRSTTTATALLFLYGATYRGVTSAVKLGKLLDVRSRALFKDRQWTMELLKAEDKMEELVELLSLGGFVGINLDDDDMDKDAEFEHDFDDGREIPQCVWDMLAVEFPVDPNAVIRYGNYKGEDGGENEEEDMMMVVVDDIGQQQWVYKEFDGGRKVHEGYQQDLYYHYRLEGQEGDDKGFWEA